MLSSHCRSTRGSTTGPDNRSGKRRAKTDLAFHNQHEVITTPTDKDVISIDDDSGRQSIDLAVLDEIVGMTDERSLAMSDHSDIESDKLESGEY